MYVTSTVCMISVKTVKIADIVLLNLSGLKKTILKKHDNIRN